jgi:hypothetical protein
LIIDEATQALEAVRYHARRENSEIILIAHFIAGLLDTYIQSEEADFSR